MGVSQRWAKFCEQPQVTAPAAGPPLSPSHDATDDALYTTSFDSVEKSRRAAGRKRGATGWAGASPKRTWASRDHKENQPQRGGECPAVEPLFRSEGGSNGNGTGHSCMLQPTAPPAVTGSAGNGSKWARFMPR